MPIGRDHQTYEDAALHWANQELRMSMDRCRECSEAVDTDEDLDCYIPVGGMGDDDVPWDVECLCEKCRAKAEAQIQQQYGRSR